MRNRLAMIAGIAVIMAALAVSARGQVPAGGGGGGGGGVTYVTSDPTGGACSPPAVVNYGGTLYSCQGGVYAVVAGAAGPPMDINALTEQLTPTLADDFVAIHDVGLAALRKVKLVNLPFEVPLTFTGASGVTRTGNTVACNVASGSLAGCLSSADWTAFNAKYGSGANAGFTTVAVTPLSDIIAGAFRRNSAGQTANIVEFQTEGNVMLSNIDKAGRFNGAMAGPNLLVTATGSGAPLVARTHASTVAGDCFLGVQNSGSSDLGCFTGAGAYKFPAVSAIAPAVFDATGTLGAGTRSGNTTEFATTSGAKTASKQLIYDADGNIIVSAYDAGAAGGGTWGSITGTLSSQTDLQNALDAKQALDADLTAIAALSCSDGEISKKAGGVWTCATDNTSGGGGAGTSVRVAFVGATTLAMGTAVHGLGANALWQGCVDTVADTSIGLTALPGQETAEFVPTWSGAKTGYCEVFTPGGAVAAVYGPAWNASNYGATQNDVYDKIEALAFSDIDGAVTDAQVPDNITVDLATAATALAANPAACSAGAYVTDIAANGTLTCSTPAGSGTVTVVSSGSLTSTALVTGGGTTTLQTPAATATMDSSGNISTPGGVTTGAGSGVAGFHGMTQGTAPTPGANEIVNAAPASVTGYLRLWPGATGTGFYLGTNSSGTETITRVSDTGTDEVVRKTAPTIVTPTIASMANANHNHTNSAGGGQITDAALSAAVGVAKGGTNLTAAADDEVMIGNGSTWQSKALPDCDNATTSKLLYDAATNAFSCGTDTTGGAGTDLNTATGDVSTTQIEDGAVTSAKVAASLKTRVCEVHIWGTGTAGVLENTDDEIVSCFNGYGATETITAVRCWSNAGSPTVTPVITDGGGAILSGALTCDQNTTAPVGAAGSLSGTPTLASGGTINANITTAGGVATNLRMFITLTR
jgi:hypothetical protein